MNSTTAAGVRAAQHTQLGNLAADSRLAIAYSCIALGICGTVAPRQIAQLLGDDPDIARRVALRDLVIGVVLLRSPSNVPLLVRTLADISDAVRLRHRSPLVATGALLFGAWSLGTAVTAALAGSPRTGSAAHA